MVRVDRSTRIVRSVDDVVPTDERRVEGDRLLVEHIGCQKQLVVEDSVIQGPGVAYLRTRNLDNEAPVRKDVDVLGRDQTARTVRERDHGRENFRILHKFRQVKAPLDTGDVE